MDQRGVEDPAKSILFRIQFEICLRSLPCAEESSLLHVACAIAMTIASSRNVEWVVICSVRIVAPTEALCGYG